MEDHKLISTFWTKMLPPPSRVIQADPEAILEKKLGG